MNAVVIFTLAAIVGYASATIDCNRPIGDCNWYSDCLQQSYPECTGTQSYALSYGKVFCNRFRQTYHSFSAEGQQWLDKVGPCLQYALLPYMQRNHTKLSCDGLKKAAFATHAPCYVSCGFCKTSLLDYFEVLRTVAPAFRTEFGEMARGILKILWKCVTGESAEHYGVCYGSNNTDNG